MAILWSIRRLGKDLIENILNTAYVLLRTPFGRNRQNIVIKYVALRIDNRIVHCYTLNS